MTADFDGVVMAQSAGIGVNDASNININYGVA